MKIITPVFLVSSLIFSNVMAQTYYNETNIDSINMRFKLDIPIPLNNIDITIQV